MSRTWKSAPILGKITVYSRITRPQAGAQKMVELTMRAVVPAHVLIRHLDGESVLLNLESERYFGLDATGTRMWELATTQP